MLRSLALPTLLLAALAAPALGAKILVPKDHPTIQAAIDAANGGDVIVVKSGVYVENLVVSGVSGLSIVAKGNVVIEAAQTDQPTILAANADSLELHGLTVKNAGASGIVGDAFSWQVRVQGCRFVDIGGTAVQLQGPAGLILGCEVAGASLGLHLSGAASAALDNVVEDVVAGPGILVEGAQCAVRGNRVERVSGHGIGTTATASDLLVRDNLVRKSDGDGIRVFGAAHRATIVDNRVEDIGEDGIQVDGDDGSITGNVVLRTVDAGLDVRGARHRIADNRFVKTGTHGVHLLAGMDADANVLEGNLVKKPGAAAFRLDGDDNVLLQNRAKKSPGADVVGSGVGNVFLDNDLLIL